MTDWETNLTGLVFYVIEGGAGKRKESEGVKAFLR